MALLPMSKGSKALPQGDPVPNAAAGAVTIGNPAGVIALLALGVAVPSRIASLSQLQAASLHCLIGPQERPSRFPLSGSPLLGQRLPGSVCRQRYYRTGILN
jgi:hypothetical protein